MPSLLDRLNLFAASRRFTVLLVAQIFALFVAPAFVDGGGRVSMLTVAIWSVLLASIFAAAARRAALVVTVILLLPATFAWVGPDWLPGDIDDALRLVSVTICLLYTVTVVGRSLLGHSRVTSETILGGINVFLLLALAFTLGHATIELALPGSYVIQGELMKGIFEPGGGGYEVFVYFSVTTLTTLGYGDIVPATQPARVMTSAEAMIGQLYVAMFIGRLVGLYVGEQNARRQAAGREGDDRDAESGA